MDMNENQKLIAQMTKNCLIFCRGFLSIILYLTVGARDAYILISVIDIFSLKLAMPGPNSNELSIEFGFHL